MLREDVKNIQRAGMYIAKLSFNFNLNLVESWDSFILHSSTPPTHQSTHPVVKKEGTRLLNFNFILVEGCFNFNEVNLNCVKTH